MKNVDKTTTVKLITVPSITQKVGVFNGEMGGNMLFTR